MLHRSVAGKHFSGSGVAGAGQAQGQEVELLAIAEAAQRLSVSTDTVHRRLRKGQLVGHQQPTPQGFTWLIEFEAGPRNTNGAAPASATADAPATAGEMHRLEKMVDMVELQMETLREELARKNTQIEQLHVLLQQQAVALRSKRKPPLVAVVVSGAGVVR